MYNTAQELLQSQTNANEAVKENCSTEIVERYQPPHTPFWFIRMGSDWWITFGKYRVNNEPLESQEDCWEYVDTHQWEIITQIILIIKNDTEA